MYILIEMKQKIQNRWMSMKKRKYKVDWVYIKKKDVREYIEKVVKKNYPGNEERKSQ